jgi:hypothetical protein
MKRFLANVLKFAIPFPLFFGAVVALFPATPQASKNLLFGERRKDYLLANVGSPRIIFAGGSNLCFGLDSQAVKDALRLNPINTGLHAGLGLRYMLENTERHIGKGDIVVVVLEYGALHKKYSNYWSKELAHMVFDVDLSKLKLLTARQILGVLPFAPEICFSKLNCRAYRDAPESGIYSADSFNEYGDVDKHWGKAKRRFAAYNEMGTALNKDAIAALRKFRANVEKKGAIIYFSYPGMQSQSFENQKHEIKQIEEEYKKAGFATLGTPERYAMDDSLMFDTPYHLNKDGVDRRTALLIEDLLETKPQLQMFE